MVVLICVVVMGLLAAGCWAWKRLHGGSASARAEEVKPGVPAAQAEAYEWGLHPGEDGQSVMFTLRTCRHCVHLKNFLTKHGIPCHLVYVDEFSGAARSEMMGQVRRYNARGSFPTLVLPGGKALVGFREHEVRAAFQLPDQD